MYRFIDLFMYIHKYTCICTCYVLKSLEPPPCPRGSAQLAGASGNFFGRNNTFFLLFIDFLKEILKKNEFFKNVHFRQIFGAPKYVEDSAKNS